MKKTLPLLTVLLLAFAMTACTADPVTTSSLPSEDGSVLSGTSSVPKEDVPETRTPLSMNAHKEDYVIETENTLQTLEITVPDEFNGAKEGTEGTVWLRDYNCRLVLVKDQTVKEPLVFGYRLKEVYIENLLKMSEENGPIQVTATEGPATKVLLEQKGTYLALFDTHGRFTNDNKDVDALFCAGQQICYAKTENGKTELGILQVEEETHTLTPTVSLEQDNEGDYIADFPLVNQAQPDKNGEVQWWLGRPDNEFPDACQAVVGYLRLTDEAANTYTVRIPLDGDTVTLLMERSSTVPARLYYNGELVCCPSKMSLGGQYADNIVSITRLKGKTILYVYNLTEIFYSDGHAWISEGNKLVEIPRTLNFDGLPDQLIIGLDGRYHYRRLVEGVTEDYFHYVDCSDMESFDEYLDAYEQVLGDDPDAMGVEEPLWEYGTVTVQHGKAVFRPTCTRSIRLMFQDGYWPEYTEKWMDNP